MYKLGEVPIVSPMMVKMVTRERFGLVSVHML